MRHPTASSTTSLVHTHTHTDWHSYSYKYTLTPRADTRTSYVCSPPLPCLSASSCFLLAAGQHPGVALHPKGTWRAHSNVLFTYANWLKCNSSALLIAPSRNWADWLPPEAPPGQTSFLPPFHSHSPLTYTNTHTHTSGCACAIVYERFGIELQCHNGVFLLHVADGMRQAACGAFKAFERFGAFVQRQRQRHHQRKQQQ